MKRAIIDIGTNSVRLLVAERPDGGEWKTVTKKVNSTRLGEGMANNKALSLAAKERTLAAVMTFADEARSAGISDLTAYGTAIFRDSPEGPEFAKAISETIKAPMHILTGKEEAFYSYIGAAGTSGALTAVVDIGGGSTEICMGFGTDIGFRISFPLGCVRCTGQFDVVGARGIGELKKHCFELFPQADEVASVKRWIFVGGTATSIAAMLQKLDVYDASRVQGFVLKPEEVSDLLKQLFSMSYEERCHIPGLRPERADIIVAGVAILDALMEYFAIPEATVSDRDLQEGLLDADLVKPE
ncbi:Ppx/GppA family phosphatase [Allisonella histaminiformans]|uniref:Ppx/GppA phosphatase family protein n=1 Tax=Allisonella histaminiformans TaxID=209880 RepID=UPI0022E29782|nr:Ppx/GppA family phosphatase [Allisonella histaminiformans]